MKNTLLTIALMLGLGVTSGVTSWGWNGSSSTATVDAQKVTGNFDNPTWQWVGGNSHACSIYVNDGSSSVIQTNVTTSTTYQVGYAVTGDVLVVVTNITTTLSPSVVTVTTPYPLLGVTNAQAVIYQQSGVIAYTNSTGTNTYGVISTNFSAQTSDGSLTISSNGFSWVTPSTNWMPNGYYMLDLTAWQGATFRTLAQGTIVVSGGINQDTPVYTNSVPVNNWTNHWSGNEL